jgi:hypothetical protein
MINKMRLRGFSGQPDERVTQREKTTVCWPEEPQQKVLSCLSMRTRHCPSRRAAGSVFTGRGLSLPSSAAPGQVM